MADGEVKKVKVHYRRAERKGSISSQTLQNDLISLMSSPLGQDTRERLLAVDEENSAGHKACLNYHKSDTTFFVADIMHLDGRSSFPIWIHPTEPKPYADIASTQVASGRASLGEPLYIMVSGNNVAVIERMGLRSSHLNKYLNALLRKGGQLSKDDEYKLVPKIEVTGDAWKSGGVKRVIVKPHAALMGFAPSEAPDLKSKRRAKAAVSDLADFAFAGQKVFDILVKLGADETKLETLRQSISADLVLKAKLELSVASVRHKTKAEVSPDDVQLALAELAKDGEILIVSENGRSDGKLTQLVHPAEVLEVNGLIEWQRAIQALSSALSAWAAKGAIEME